MPHLPDLALLWRMTLAIAIGATGGAVAHWLGLPMPWLIGAFAASAVSALSRVRLAGIEPALPMPVRNAFVAVIGVMIGGSFHPGIFASIETIWLPIVAVVVFVVGTWVMNYALFRRIGGYDAPTAFYAGMPGGLIEAIAFGEKVGADAATLSLQQFARIALVITTLPFLFMIWRGEAVGSAAGMTLVGQDASLNAMDALILVSCAITGYYGGKLIRFPAHILTGPLVLSALAHYFGLTEAAPPIWLIATAQVMVGTGLGMRFKGFDPRRIGRVFGLALISVTLMLGFDAGLVLGLRLFIDTPFDVLLISLAPGGVTETALIALSLHANPVFVTTLHVFRIFLAVILSSMASRHFIRQGTAKP